jgi:uncharacterized membrane protein
VLEGKNEVWKTIHVNFISARKENSHDQGTYANDSLLYTGLIWQGSAPSQNGSGSFLWRRSNFSSGIEAL